MGWQRRSRLQTGKGFKGREVKGWTEGWQSKGNRSFLFTEVETGEPLIGRQNTPQCSTKYNIKLLSLDEHGRWTIGRTDARPNA